MRVVRFKTDMEEHIRSALILKDYASKFATYKHRIDVYEGCIVVSEYREYFSDVCSFENGADNFENVYDLTYEDFLLFHMTNRWSCSIRDLEVYYTLYEFCVGRLTQEEVDVKVNEILKEEK